MEMFFFLFFFRGGVGGIKCSVFHICRRLANQTDRIVKAGLSIEMNRIKFFWLTSRAGLFCIHLQFANQNSRTVKAGLPIEINQMAFFG